MSDQRSQRGIRGFRWWQIPLVLDGMTVLWTAIVVGAARNIPAVAQCTRHSQDCDWLISALNLMFLINILAHVGLFLTAKGDSQGLQLLYGIFHIIFLVFWLWLFGNLLLLQEFRILS